MRCQCLVMPDTVEMDSQQTKLVDDCARNLVAHPTAHPCIGADQHTDHRGVPDAFSDEALDRLRTFESAVLPEAAVREAIIRGSVNFQALRTTADRITSS